MKANKLTKETILNLGVYERNFPKFKSGDTIIATTVIKEGEKSRQQQFEGTVISIKGKGIAKTFCIRKTMDGVAVERIIPFFSPSLTNIILKNEGDVRRAKLYYLRDRTGKRSEIKLKKKIKKTTTINPSIITKNTFVDAAL